MESAWWRCCVPRCRPGRRGRSGDAGHRGSARDRSREILFQCLVDAVLVPLDLSPLDTLVHLQVGLKHAPAPSFHQIHAFTVRRSARCQ